MCASFLKGNSVEPLLERRENKPIRLTATLFCSLEPLPFPINVPVLKLFVWKKQSRVDLLKFCMCVCICICHVCCPLIPAEFYRYNPTKGSNWEIITSLLDKCQYWK